MKVRSGYHQIELELSDILFVQKEGTMLYLRVTDNLGVIPSFRVDFQCQSDQHALQIMEGLHGKSYEETRGVSVGP